MDTYGLHHLQDRQKIPWNYIVSFFYPAKTSVSPRSSTRETSPVAKNEEKRVFS